MARSSELIQIIKDKETVCMLCKQSTDDPEELGEKLQHENITVHFFCLLLSSNLSTINQNEYEISILGFSVADVRAEIKRSSSVPCCYCGENSAAIDCCKTNCQRSFHLHCAVVSNCRFEFFEPFRSFCHSHHDVDDTTVHKFNEDCGICHFAMSQYRPIRSVNPQCCRKWFHKRCLLKTAREKGHTFNCPSCGNNERFKESIKRIGIYIPNGLYGHLIEADLNETLSFTESEDDDCSEEDDASQSEMEELIFTTDEISITSYSDFGLQSNVYEDDTNVVQAIVTLNTSSSGVSDGSSDQMSNSSSDLTGQPDVIEEESGPKKSNKGRRVCWKGGDFFKTLKEAEIYLKSQCFEKHHESENSNGYKAYYRCKKVPRGFNCISQRMIESIPHKSGYLVKYNVLDHNHDQLQIHMKKKKSSFSDDLVSFVLENKSENLTNRQIIDLIKEKQQNENQFTTDNIPTTRQIYTMFEKFGTVSVNSKDQLNSFVFLCKPKVEVPSAANEPFVLKLKATQHQVHAILTTFALLQNTVNIRNICIDTSRILKWRKHPIFIVGTIDSQKNFHLIAVYICSTYEEADFVLLFNSLIESSKRYFEFEMKPSIMVSDCSDKKIEAFKKTFGKNVLQKYIMAWNHVAQTIAKATLQQARHRNQIKNDVKVMKQMTTQENFNSVSKLFYDKYHDLENNFAESFATLCIGRYNNWFEDIADYSKVEVAEVVNRDISLRSNLPADIFVESLCEILSTESIQYTTSKKSASATTISIPTEAFRIFAEERSDIMATVENYESSSTHYYYILKSKKNSAKEDEVQSPDALKTQQWSSFDEYVEHGFDMYYDVTVYKHKDEYKTRSRCTCAEFQSLAYCRHIVAVALHKKVIKCPKNANPTPIGAKAKKGRKKNATNGLSRN